MKTNRTFANLPVAAILLLVASLPCFAQVTGNESTSVVAVANNGQTVALKMTLRAVPPSLEETTVSSKNVDRTKSPLNLTPATFKVSDQFNLDSTFLSGTQLKREAPDSKQQFRLDDDTTSRSTVTFVPSRGPRLPQ
jgi:hypothetical protein